MTTRLHNFPVATRSIMWFRYINCVLEMRLKQRDFLKKLIDTNEVGTMLLKWGFVIYLFIYVNKNEVWSLYISYVFIDVNKSRNGLKWW